MRNDRVNYNKFYRKDEEKTILNNFMLMTRYCPAHTVLFI